MVIVPSTEHYAALLDLLVRQKGESTAAQRAHFAAAAFGVSSRYDSAIYRWLAGDGGDLYRINGNMLTLAHAGAFAKEKTE